MDIFLLTKPPGSTRAEICLKLLERSADARLYLAGDGVYLLLDKLDLLPADRVFACQEDLEARGDHGEGASLTVPECFYEHLVNDLMQDAIRVYAF